MAKKQNEALELIQYITKAIHALLKYAFYTLQFHSVEAIIDPDNIASEHVL